MSGGTFTRCQDCDRLLIYGQRCVCDESAPRRCDCTYSGNKQHIGPKCAERIREVWADAVSRSREIAKHIKETA